MKKAISILLALTMLFTLCVPVYAEDTESLTVFSAEMGGPQYGASCCFLLTYNAMGNWQRSQYIIPASLLTDLGTGAEISALTYYNDTYYDAANITWSNSHMQFYLQEVDKTTFTDGETSFIDYSSAVKVYDGALSFADHVMQVSFTTPYTYQGGNLLITFVEADKSTFAGVTSFVSYHDDVSFSMYNSNLSSLDSMTGCTADGVPKTTLTYTPASEGSNRSRYSLGNVDLFAGEVSDLTGSVAPAIDANPNTGLCGVWSF